MYDYKNVKKIWEFNRCYQVEREKNLNEHLASDIVDRFPNITKMCKNEIKRNVPMSFRLHDAVLESKCTLLESCSQGDKAVDNFE